MSSTQLDSIYYNYEPTHKLIDLLQKEIQLSTHLGQATLTGVLVDVNEDENHYVLRLVSDTHIHIVPLYFPYHTFTSGNAYCFDYRLTTLCINNDRYNSLVQEYLDPWARELSSSNPCFDSILLIQTL